jgi:signal transduction histidine kinase
MAEEELARVTHLTKQTLGFYRDSGAPEPVDITALIEGVLNIYHSKLKARQITVVKEFNTGEKLNTVAGEVRQIISNLLANAIDASPKNGVITIRMKPLARAGNHASGVRITIADTGSGINPAYKSKIWEPFFTTKKDIGTGLGLWVIKQIVEKHSGTIRFKSNKNGTVFMVFLPSMAVEHARSISAEMKVQ